MFFYINHSLLVMTFFRISDILHDMDRWGGRIVMRIIRKRILILETAICIWILMLIFFLQVSLNDVYIIIFWIFEAAVTILLIFLLMKECRIYEDANLIVENTIVCIPSALIKRDVNFEIYISCFGILIDSKVIKYNVGNIILKGVEINREYICIDYGRNERIQQTCILHGNISEEEQKRISKRFHYETGIMPVIKH